MLFDDLSQRLQELRDEMAMLSKESGEPVHIGEKTGDLSADLKRGLAVLRKQRNSKK
ncbi:MAG: hypothetical protein QOD84_682 [Acidobacteriaceae bacterium]|jgi:hypothetical protein